MRRHRLAGLLAKTNAVNVAHVVERCRVVGPGERFVLWVQGCPLRCPGCHNPQFIPFRNAQWVSVADLVRRICAVDGIEGVTYVGGEPFVQAEALAAVSRRLKRQDMTVMAYSGFTIDELRSNAVPDSIDLLDELDLLLDGPFRQDQPTTKPWRGSDNQRLIALSPRYREVVPLWNAPVGQEFEVRFLGNGELEFLGIPPAETTPSSTATNNGLSNGHRCSTCD